MPARTRRNAGVLLALVTVALLALLASAALAVDVGRLMVAAGRAQTVADFAALAGANHLPNDVAAGVAAWRMIQAYNTGVIGKLSATVTIYHPGETLPDGRTLGPAAWAIRVRAAVQTDFVFARVFGLLRGAPAREALVVYGPVSSAPIVPIWIPDDDYVHGQPLDFFYSPVNGTDDWLPGNFGWLQSPDPRVVSFIELLSGENLTAEQLRAATVRVGDVLSGKTGVAMGQCRDALQGRLDRASQPPFDTDTIDDFHNDNPRLMIIPLVDYLGGTGANASFSVKRFAVAWLDSVDFNGANSKMTVRFVEYKMKATPDLNAPAGDIGAWQLIR